MIYSALHMFSAPLFNICHEETKIDLNGTIHHECTLIETVIFKLRNYFTLL